MKLIMFSSWTEMEQEAYIQTDSAAHCSVCVWWVTADLKEGECCPLQETFCIADLGMQFL